MVNQVNKNTGWTFTFTRAISSLQSQFQDGQWSYVNPDALPSVDAPWAQEACIITVDKDGLCKLWWQGASVINRTVTESSQLVQFEIIKQRISNQLNFIYGTHENATGNGLDIKISKIELGISLISVKDQYNVGQYSPTWYVSYNYKWRDDEDIEDNWFPGQIMFSAINANYIEPRITNEKILSISSEK